MERVKTKLLKAVTSLHFYKFYSLYGVWCRHWGQQSQKCLNCTHSGFNRTSKTISVSGAAHLLRSIKSFTHVFVCRSKQSCGDGCGGVTIKIISLQPSGVSLRSQFKPAGGLGGLLLAATSLQYDFKKLTMREELLWECQAKHQRRPSKLNLLMTLIQQPLREKTTMNSGEWSRKCCGRMYYISVSSRQNTFLSLIVVWYIFYNGCNQKNTKK